MIVYRTQIHNGPDWTNEWFGTLVEAEAALGLGVSLGFEAHVDQMEVTTDKESLIAALNAADHNRMNWPGVQKLPKVRS